MKISYSWLKNFVDLKRYSAPELADLLTMNFAEVDGIKTLGDDLIFDLKILPDRASDCLSHYGVARELAALTKLKVKSLKFKVKESKKINIKDLIEVENQNPEICKRYISRVILDVKVGASPKWLKERLESLGQKSINNVVDATNYVMLELGQPMHIFDFDKIKNMQVKSEKSMPTGRQVKAQSEISKIIIRKAKVGEKITTLDNQEIELNEDVLVIVGSDTPNSKLQTPSSILAIAGIKGGKKAEIDQNTKNIILESANFSAEAIRKASKLTGIRTESSARFSADLDPNLAGIAIERLASLLVQISGGEAVSGKIDIYPRKVMSAKVAVSLNDVISLLGEKISEKEFLSIFKQLNFKVEKIYQEKELMKLARKFIGRPYKYGASTSQDAPETFDCSSFVQYLYWQIGIEIPRISVEQFLFARSIEKKDLKIGDLAFRKGGRPYFYKETPRGIGHVGVYIGKGRVVHASGDKKKVIEEKLETFCKKDFRGFGRIADLGDEAFVIEIPTYRRDIRMKADIIEEIGRIYGYQNIKSKLPEGILMLPQRNDEIFWENLSKNALVSTGFTEVYNYSFIGGKDLKAGFIIPENILELQNYISDDKRYLRPSLIFGFLRNIEENFRYFNETRIFEVGKIFTLNAKEKISERKFIGGVISLKGKRNSAKAEEFYELKATVDLLMQKLGVPEFWYDDYQATPEIIEGKIWHNLRLAEIKIGDERVGFIGEINPNVIGNYDIDGRVAMFEIDFASLACLANEDFIYSPISKFPAIERDLAILTPINVKVDDVLNVLENIGGQLLINTDLFDVYEGDNIQEGKKSLAFHLIFQSRERTLSDKEVDEILAEIIVALSEEGWEIRR